jgi:hypothetical protein
MDSIFGPRVYVPQGYPLWIHYTTGEAVKTQLIVAWVKGHTTSKIYPVVDTGISLDDMFPVGTPYSYFISQTSDPGLVAFQSLTENFRNLVANLPKKEEANG